MFTDIPFFRNQPYSDDVDARFANLDIRKLAKDVSLKSTDNIEDFSERLKRILDRFLAEQTPMPIPKRNVALAQFAKLQNSTRKLLDALNKMDKEQNFAWFELQDAYEAHFPSEDEPTTHGGPDEGLSSFEINFERLIISLSRFATLIDDKREETSPNGSKGLKDEATYNAVHRLADLYEDFAKVSANIGFTKLKKTEKDSSNAYDGPFFLFVEECISSFAPEFYRGNSSLGNIISRAFKEYPRQYPH